MKGEQERPLEEFESEVTLSIREKLHADLGALAAAITGCRGCPNGDGGIPGEGEAGAELFFLAGMPGPGARRGDPWGRWREQVIAKACGEWGWSVQEAYFSTALRCRLPKVTRREVRRCAPLLAEEVFLVGPRLVVVSGKVAAVALRAALGDEIPENPKAGDTCSLFSATFLFELDVARIEREADAARTFWRILRGAEGLLDVRPAT